MSMLEKLRQLFKQAEQDPNPETEEMLELRSRSGLEETDCYDMMEWFSQLPETTWSLPDLEQGLRNLLESREAILTIPKRFNREAVYFKLRWG